MILVDYSQTVIASVFAESKGGTSFELDEDIIRHIILNTLRSHYMKFKNTYGEMVIAVDSKNYWRRDLFQNYKGNRGEKKVSTIDWKHLYEIMDKVQTEISVALPFKTIKVNRAEADDVIAVLSTMEKEDSNSLFGGNELVKIISSDKDFIQLQKHKHISQYNPMFDKELKPLVSAKYDLQMKIIEGDSGDCIPNIRSNIDDIFNKVRQKPIKSTMKEEWSVNPMNVPQEYLGRYEENKKLIDFDYIPTEYREKIIEAYDKASVGNEALMYEYFKSKGLMKMLENIKDFT